MKMCSAIFVFYLYREEASMKLLWFNVTTLTLLLQMSSDGLAFGHGLRRGGGVVGRGVG